MTIVWEAGAEFQAQKKKAEKKSKILPGRYITFRLSITNGQVFLCPAWDAPNFFSSKQLHTSQVGHFGIWAEDYLRKT